MDKNSWDNAECSQGWLKNLLENDSETAERRKKVKPMPEDMQDLFEYLDDPCRKDYPDPKNSKN